MTDKPDLDAIRAIAERVREDPGANNGRSAYLLAVNTLGLLDDHAWVAWLATSNNSQLNAARGHTDLADARIAAAKQLAAEYAAHTEPGERAEVPVDELLVALNGESS